MLQVIAIIALTLVTFSSFFISQRRMANQESSVALFRIVSFIASILTIILSLDVIL
jgi:hypothetical protein